MDAAQVIDELEDAGEQWLNQPEIARAIDVTMFLASEASPERRAKLRKAMRDHMRLAFVDGAIFAIRGLPQS